jgi:hypothetical protein
MAKYNVLVDWMIQNSKDIIISKSTCRFNAIHVKIPSKILCGEAKELEKQTILKRRTKRMRNRRREDKSVYLILILFIYCH